MAESEPKSGAQETEALAAIRIAQEHKTKRTLIISVAIVLIVLIIALAVVKIAERPLWEVLIVTIGSTLALVAGGQYGFFAYLMHRIRRYTQLNQSRVTDIEKRHDPNRTSSELKRDGTGRVEELT